MAKALYRKYRPKTLAEVVGQEQVTKTLAQAMKQGKISHAYLFIGPRGTGKTSVARIFAHEINEFDYEIEDDYIDIIEIDGASNRGIDDIRELREKAAIAPTKGKYKIYIIDEVHMLTREAFNALLKTLEEPPEHVVFIMATTDAHKVPATIVSRAQTYAFHLADTTIMLPYLRQVAEAEKLKITDEALEVIVRRGGGSFRDSLSLLDQISTLTDQEITAGLISQALGLPDTTEIISLLEYYQAGDLAGMVEKLKELLAAGIKPEMLAEGLVEQIVANPRPELLNLLARLTEVKAPFPEAKLLVALTQELQRPVSPTVNSERPAKVVNETITKAPQTPESSKVTTKPSQPEPEPPEQPGPIAATAFDWAGFLERVQSLNDAIYLQLMKVTHEVIQGTLHIYPPRKIIKTILSKDKNRQILTSEAHGLKIQIHEVDEKPMSAAKNTKISDMEAKISDIMGGEVKEDGGKDPF